MIAHELKRLVEQHIDARTGLRAAIEQLAEDITQDLLADEAFRASVKTLIQTHLSPSGQRLDTAERRLRRWYRVMYGLLAFGVLAIVTTAVTVILRSH